VTERGRRKRQELIAAARVVFERLGYVATRLTDITAEAKCSIGTFYLYFDTKEEIFAAILDDLKEDMLHPGFGHVADDADPAAVIEATNRAYLVTYKRNARMMDLLDQVSSIDPEFRKLRKKRSDEFTRRNSAFIADLQARGIADPAMDPYLVATALSLTTGRLAFYAFVLGTKATVDELVETSTRIWCSTLGLELPAPSST
jgi:AcrR family transcriptional regulator